MNRVPTMRGRSRQASHQVGWERRLRAGGLALLTLGGLGCSLEGVVNSDELPDDITDPKIVETPGGAKAAYNGALAEFASVFAGNITNVLSIGARFTDELHSRSSGGIDSRNISEGSPEALFYGRLQATRNHTAQAIGLMANFLPGQPELRGHLYALKAYIEMFLAELYCSGIPLSTIDYGKDYTYQAGSSTDQVFTHALALLDTALVLAEDSARFANLARVGQARALLALGRYADAETAAADVPNDYRYNVAYNSLPDSLSASLKNFAAFGHFGNNASHRWNLSVSDREGVNGADWRTSGDPRTPIIQRTDGVGSFYYPSRYDTLGRSPITLASGVEVQLAKAEAQLQAGDDGWLITLNALRTDGTQDGGGTYQPGTGGVAGLAPLADPGSGNGQVDLLFRERGFWLFLTGHRQGDLRRLVRVYGRDQGAVYPVGPSSGGDISVPIPPSEYANPLYTGCSSRV